jgi:proline iminopeptidase
VKRAEIMAAGNLEVAHYEKLFRLSFNITAYDRRNMGNLNLNLPENFSNANRALFTGLMKERRDINYYDSIGVFTFPVLIVHGKADGIPYASVQRLTKNISGSQLEIFEKSGHFPFIEEPELYLETVQSFLKQHQKGGKKRRN